MRPKATDNVTFPYSIVYRDVYDADQFRCPECQSVYKFSETMVNAGNASHRIIYCRFTNELYMSSNWNEAEASFAEELRGQLQSAPQLLKDPLSHPKRAKFCPRLIEHCPHCGAVIPQDAWTKIPGLTKIPFLELAMKRPAPEGSFTFKIPGMDLKFYSRSELEEMERKKSGAERQGPTLPREREKTDDEET